MKHNRAVLLLTAAVLILLGTAMAAAASAETLIGMANPWRTLSAEELRAATGCRMNIPDAATDVCHRHLTTINLAEVQFTLEGNRWCARMLPTAAWEDISGLYYPWCLAESCTILGHEAQLLQAIDGDARILLCLWHDGANTMYALSVRTEGACQPDVPTLASTLFSPPVQSAPTTAE